jgi:sensor histidine kinase YesM
MFHVLCWGFLFALPYLLRPSFDASRKLIEENRQYLEYLVMINRVIWVGLFYFNAFVIVPRVIYKRKFRTYIVVLLVIFLTLFLIDWAVFKILLPEVPYYAKNFFSFNIYPIIFILALSTAYRMIQDRIKEDRLQKEKENENLKTELSLLRSQVSPHFMFNIMNNMVALARKKSDILEPSLIKLSSLLRYMLYETDERVALQKEIEYLQSYIDLQKQRFGNNVMIKTCMEKVEDSFEIEPMLLIPFVENAFKHGTG